MKLGRGVFVVDAMLMWRIYLIRFFFNCWLKVLLRTRMIIFIVVFLFSCGSAILSCIREPFRYKNIQNREIYF